MAVSVFPSLCLGVLAVFMVDDIGMSRTQLGVVAAVISAVTALTSISLGSLADRRGGRLLLLVVFLAGALGIAGYAVAPSYPILLGAALVAGVCQGASNPATNRLVSETIEPHRQAVVTGIKQSGEMMAVVACGAVLPASAVAFGWRGALALAAVLPAVAIVVVLVGVPGRSQPARPAGRARPTEPVGWRTWWLAGYALLVGLVGASVMTYLALYAQESLGLDVTSAGLVVAGMGFVAIVSRVAWGVAAGRMGSSVDHLVIISALALVASSILWSSTVLGQVALWVGGFLWALSVLSFGTVGMLAALKVSTAANVGRASGIVLVGFSIGLMLGPPLFGAAVDATGSYGLGFAGITTALIVLTGIGLTWRRREAGLEAIRAA